MRVLLVNPYNSAPTGHAADDMSAPLVTGLRDYVDLTLAGPNKARWWSAAQRNVASRFGLAPGSIRKDWPRSATRRISASMAKSNFDILHLEYLQTAELLQAIKLPSIITLHDISSAVHGRYIAYTNGPLEHAYRSLERVRIEQFESKAMSRATFVVTLSGWDADYIRQKRDNVAVIHPGIPSPTSKWHPPDTVPTFLFFGALWRRTNQIAVNWLVKSVMPHVWSELPEAQLLVAGSKPPPRLQALNGPRVRIEGFVPDKYDFFSRGHIAALPTMIGGGVLLKVLTALAVGCPVVTTTLAARAITEAGACLAVADDPEEYAALALSVLADPLRQASMGAAGLRIIAEHYSPGERIRRYLKIYGLLSNT